MWKNLDIAPMLLKQVDKPFNDSNYIYEIKFDGIRALIFAGPNYFKIISRNKKDITDLYPELSVIKNMVDKNTILDGEIVSFDNNKPSFSKLQERNHLKNKNIIKEKSYENPVTFVAFDIIYQGKDITMMPLYKRKELLNSIEDNDYLVKSRIYNDGIKLFKKVKKLGLEGIVAKKKDDAYYLNTRTSSWLKIKNLREAEFIIGGFEYMKEGYLSLILGEVLNGSLYFVGRVSLYSKNKLYQRIINSKKMDKSPFVDYEASDTNYIKETIFCKVKYLERTKNNHLRQPIIKEIL